MHPGVKFKAPPINRHEAGERGVLTSNNLKPLPYRSTPCFSCLAICFRISLDDGKFTFPCRAPILGCQ